MNSYLLGNDLTVDSFLAVDSGLLELLEQTVALAQEQLGIFANDPEFAEKMTMAFGDRINPGELQAKWQVGDLSSFPALEILAANELNGANGTYAAATSRIYLSAEFLQAHLANPEDAVGVLLEEIGHGVDALLNQQDSAGDEGAIFSALVRGESLTAETLALLKAEDDSGVINVNGQAIAVEQQYFTGDDGNNTITGTPDDDYIDGRGGDDSLSGGAGNDYLDGGTGNDTLNGGDGDDRLVIDGLGSDSVDGGTGDDRLEMSQSGATDDLSIGANIQNVESAYIQTGSGNDTIDLSSFPGSSTYWWWRNTQVSAGAGNDTVVGTVGNDNLYGEGGDDSLSGGAGNDYLDGGAGNDTLIGANPNSLPLLR
jgi:Ca2+-binding RTX toxin-like protein